MKKENEKKAIVEKHSLQDGQRRKLDRFTREAKLLEKEINLMIKRFEKKHNLHCWVSHNAPGKICIEISIDSDHL